jgi:hypothetical protein
LTPAKTAAVNASSNQPPGPLVEAAVAAAFVGGTIVGGGTGVDVGRAVGEVGSTTAGCAGTDVLVGTGGGGGAFCTCDQRPDGGAIFPAFRERQRLRDFAQRGVGATSSAHTVSATRRLINWSWRSVSAASPWRHLPGSDQHVGGDHRLGERWWRRHLAGLHENVGGEDRFGERGRR